jgi:superfamily I DNA/RNA helicase
MCIRDRLDLLRLLATDPPNVCVVGDDDQSIYGWRGAEVSNILEFERHFPEPKIIKLEENYRSTTTILRAANSVIQNNPRRRAKSLWSSRGAGDLIRLIGIPGEREEARFVAEEIHKRQVEENLPWQDFAVLFRMNTQSQPFEEQFRQLKLPYRLIGARSFFDRREVKDLIAWLTVLIHSDDDISLLRIINAPPRGIGETTVGRALDASVQNNCSVFATLRSDEFQSGVSKKTAESIRHFIEIIEEFGVRMTAPLADYPALALRLIEETGYREYLKRSCQTAEEAAGREESLNRVLDWMKDRKTSQSALREFLDELVLNRDTQDDDDDKCGITLITMHAAKGLEFKHVYVVGMEEGVLPHSRSKEENRTDEERRLFYVALTRAMRTLCLTWCQSRVRYGQAMPCTRSSFLSEIDPALVCEESYHELQNRPAAEATAKLHFAAIREMLSTARKEENSTASDKPPEF